MKGNILVIEDDRVLNGLIVEHLRGLGYEPTPALSWAQARDHLHRREPKLIIMDVRLPDANGVELLNELSLVSPVILLTAFGSVRDAVEAMKAGASEYLLKPITLDELELVVERVLSAADLESDHRFCKQLLQSQADRFMIGSSPALNEVQQLIEAVAPNDISVLIQGESGVGKELVAQAIHDCSARSGRNFVAVDCCTLQEKLFESEVFGHERGAFTDAKRQKKGLIEGAEGGTLFLDEIGEIEPAIQAKLLRVLETGKFRRLGGTRDLDANVRIVAATNRDLERMSRDGGFRSDLYYRLAAFVIDVPPLRQRREDILPLAKHFVENHNFSKRIDKRFSTTAQHMLTAYDWPGNIRELKNIVERAIILSGDSPVIRPEHLSFSSSQLSMEAGFSLNFDVEPTLQEIERRYLEQLLERYSGHRSRIARILGISERSVYRMLEKHGLRDRQEIAADRR
ncbi:MAG TPA: sigma-54-dependent Fis family transcriptional regulator [Sedimenticola thiotaurini]|uniref:Sigma-54-dependent Fis family transcriptional regulator n=1 Tax=Sedimenticola thiotaurini TaxID=1543721 RepID=A0A831RNU5_9GAMM|nr:sigma-54-dependent Fis family transcriptional regulator [Sedimenticola thiotaurini]